jgi:triphosphoribosyl-dephospho-CoA synthetase
MDEFVTISAKRLKELQELEKTLPTLIEDAIKKYKKNCLEKLHERDKKIQALLKHVLRNTLKNIVKK